MAIAVDSTLPDIELTRISEDGPDKVSASFFFADKKAVLFAVPGAFTPTCTLNHLPGYIENAEAIKANGVDMIAVVAVNDPFVVQAWADQSGAGEKVTFLADWDGSFTTQLGMDIDLSAAGLGRRSKRYSMIVENGKVTALNIEDSPGTAVESGAAKILEQL